MYSCIFLPILFKKFQDDLAEKFLKLFMCLMDGQQHSLTFNKKFLKYFFRNYGRVPLGNFLYCQVKKN